MKRTSIRILIIALASLALGACGSLNTGSLLPDKRVEYKKARQSATELEIPPDLSRDTIAQGGVVFDGPSPAVTTYSEYVAAKRGTGTLARSQRSVLPSNPEVQIRRDGDKRWLVIQSSPSAVWDKVLDFWQENGILLVEQDPSAGVMRTAWIENRANIKSDFLTNFIRKSLDGLYATGTRDQYRVRLERGASGATELYLTHTGMEEKLVSGAGSSETDQGVWTPSGTDHELEAIMLQRLLAFMGASDAAARVQRKSVGSDTPASGLSSLTTTGTPNLAINTDFARSWRLVGIALNRVGFTVEDRNRTAGNYYVRYNDPSDDQPESSGWLSKMAFWRSSKKINDSALYLVNVSGSASPTIVTVMNENGTPASRETSARILSLLHDQLR